MGILGDLAVPVAPELARELNVEAVIEGSVRRERCFEQRDPNMPYIFVVPGYDGPRVEPHRKGTRNRIKIRRIGLESPGR